MKPALAPVRNVVPSRSAMAALYACSEPRLPDLGPQHLAHRRADRRGRFRDHDSGALQRLHLVAGAALAAGDDRAGMTHPPAGRCGAAGDKPDDRLLRPSRLQEFGAVFLGTAADFADHDDRLGLVIGEKHLEHLDEVRAVDRITTDADAARLPQTDRCGLSYRLIGQGAGARDDADLAAAMNMPGHDADLALVGSDDTRAVGADQPRTAAGETALDADHVEDRDALGDADDQRDLGIGRLEDRIGGEGRRHIDHARVAAGRGAGLMHGVEDRQVEVPGPAFPRCHAADHLGAVGDRLLGVERALGAGDPLADDFGRGVDEDRHQRASLTAATTFCAASARLSAARIGSPDCRMIRLPRSTLVPSRRTTSGTCRLTSRAAATTPSAITSQRMIPPNMLTRIPSTLGSLRISLKAVVTRSLVAPPPTSRKFAGLLPCNLMMSIVAIARPAPLTMQPILPSSLM